VCTNLITDFLDTWVHLHLQLYTGMVQARKRYFVQHVSSKKAVVSRRRVYRIFKLIIQKVTTKYFVHFLPRVPLS